MEKKITLDQIDKGILAYLKFLLEQKGALDLPSEIVANMIIDLYARFEGFLMANFLKELNNEMTEKFEELIQKEASFEELKTFLEENSIKVEEVVQNTMVEFGKTYLGE